MIRNYIKKFKRRNKAHYYSDSGDKYRNKIVQEIMSENDHETIKLLIDNLDYSY